MSDFIPSFQLVALAKYAREKAETAEQREADLWLSIADEIESFADGETETQPDLFGAEL